MNPTEWVWSDADLRQTLPHTLQRLVAASQCQEPSFASVMLVVWEKQHARLDAFFDENEGRYYITPQSVTRAIEEERAKQTATGAAPPAGTEIPKRSETPPRQDAESSDRMKELERQNRDLEIATREKGLLSRTLGDRTWTVRRESGRNECYVGELETQVLQLGGAPRRDRSLPKSAGGFGTTPHPAKPTPDAGSFPDGGVAL